MAHPATDARNLQPLNRWYNRFSRMPLKRVANKKEKSSLVPVAAQRRIYELSYRSILLRELLGYSDEYHADFAEIGALTALTNASPVRPSIHSMGARIARGENLRDIASEIANLRDSHSLAKISGVLSPIEEIIPDVSTSLLHHPDRLAVVSTGEMRDRSAWESVFRFAGRHRIPILFIVAGHYRSRVAHSLDLRSTYAEFAIPVITVDAYDAIGAYRIATEASYNARAGRGATVLEASLIATANQKVNSQAPLEHLEEYMRSRGAWDDSWREQIAEAVEQELKLRERTA